MKRIILALTFGAACAGLGACAEDGYYYGPHDHYYSHRPVAYDGWYDGYYGPIYDGYWGDGGFYYSTGEGRPYVLDRDGHFGHEGREGWSEIHGGRWRH